MITNDGKYTAKEYLVEVGNPVPLRRLMLVNAVIGKVKSAKRNFTG